MTWRWRLVHINQCPYGAIRHVLVLRKILEVELRRSRIHSVAVLEKLNVSGVTQDYDLAD